MNYIRHRHNDLNVYFVGSRCTNSTYSVDVQRRRARFGLSAAGSRLVYFW